MQHLGVIAIPNVLRLERFARLVAKKAVEAERARLLSYDKTDMNGFVSDLYDEKTREGKHGHYETVFHVVHCAIKRVASD